MTTPHNHASTILGDAQPGIGLHTATSVHYGTAIEIRAQRTATLDAAYAANPTRFTRRPHPPKLPTIAWINQPIKEVAQSA
jgi:putative transposase